MQGWFNICINIIHHTDGQWKKSVITLIDIQDVFDKISYLFMITSLYKLSIKENFLDFILKKSVKPNRFESVKPNS